MFMWSNNVCYLKIVFQLAVIVVICVCSWWKRKKIAEMASKISTATVRKSVWMRKSLKRMSTRFDWGVNN